MGGRSEAEELTWRSERERMVAGWQHRGSSGREWVSWRESGAGISSTLWPVGGSPGVRDG